MEPVTIDLMKRLAARAGYAWSDEELETLRPQVERSLAELEKLNTLALRDVDPSTRFPMD